MSAEPEVIAKALRDCAQTHDADVRLVGNVRADEIVALCDAYATAIAERDAARQKWDELIAIANRRAELVMKCPECGDMKSHANCAGILRAQLAAAREVTALIAVALPDFKWAAWLLLHASKQGVNEHRSMGESQSVVTQHIERIEAAITAAAQGDA